MSATDLEALKGFRLCCETEGLIIALETAHAVWATFELAKTLPKDQDIVMVSLFVLTLSLARILA
jgi:tryptophan synthase